MIVLEVNPLVQFTALAIKTLEGMEAIRNITLVVWSEAHTFHVSTLCRTFEVQYSVARDGRIQIEEHHYSEHHLETEVVDFIELTDITSFMDQLNKFFGLLEP